MIYISILSKEYAMPPNRADVKSLGYHKMLKLQQLNFTQEKNDPKISESFFSYDVNFAGYKLLSKVVISTISCFDPDKVSYKTNCINLTCSL